MVERSVSDCSPGRSEGQRPAVELSSRSVPILGSFVDNLVESWEDVVSELDFCYGGVAGYCQADGKTGDALFGEGSVEHAIHSVFFDEAGCAPEHSSEFDVLSEYFSAEWRGRYVGSVARAISMAELTAVKRLILVRYSEAGMSFARG